MYAAESHSCDVLGEGRECVLLPTHMEIMLCLGEITSPRWYLQEALYHGMKAVYKQAWGRSCPGEREAKH